MPSKDEKDKQPATNVCKEKTKKPTDPNRVPPTNSGIKQDDANKDSASTIHQPTSTVKLRNGDTGNSYKNSSSAIIIYDYSKVQNAAVVQKQIPFNKEKISVSTQTEKWTNGTVHNNSLENLSSRTAITIGANGGETMKRLDSDGNEVTVHAMVRKDINHNQSESEPNSNLPESSGSKVKASSLVNDQGSSAVDPCAPSTKCDETEVKRKSFSFVCQICSHGFSSGFEFSCHLTTHSAVNLNEAARHEKALRDNAGIPRLEENITGAEMAVTCVGSTVKNLETNKQTIHKAEELCRCVYDEIKACELREEERLKAESSSGQVDASSLTQSKKSETHSNVLASCSICGMAFSSFMAFLNHLKAHEEEKQNRATSSFTSRTDGHPDEPETVETKFKCHICGQTRRDKIALQTHLLVHEGGNPLKCPICGFQFTSGSDIQSHLETHVNEQPCQNPMQIENGRASSRFNVTQHAKLIVDESGEQIYKCSLCSRTCPDMYTIETHLLAHSVVKNYICSICGKPFHDQWRLKIHMKSHEKRNILECPLCKKSFARELLQPHMRVQHPDENNFKCSICGNVYFNKTGLRSHMRVHNRKKKGNTESNSEDS